MTDLLNPPLAVVPGRGAAASRGGVYRGLFWLSLVLLLAIDAPPVFQPAAASAQEQPGAPAPGSRAVYPHGFQDRLVAQFPSGETTSMAFAPDGRLFVTMKDGRIWVVQDGRVLPQPFLEIDVTSDFERGLQSLAFHPDFTDNRFVYVYYTTAATAEHPPQNRVSRFRASATDPNRAEPGSEEVLLDGIAGDLGHHNGGALHFGPDGMLYVGTGDGQRAEQAQDLSSLSGKILRLNPDGTIPQDNPFAAQPGARGEVWALGLRNVFTFAIHPVSGLLIVNDVGAERFEQVNLVEPGGNYGWPLCEGPCGREGLIDPLYSYPTVTEQGRHAITGAVFYTGDAFPPEYRDRYFFADYIAPEGWLKYLDPESGEVSTFATGLSGVLDLDVGPNGALYYLSIFEAAVYQIVWTGEPYPVAVARAEPTSGAPPLDVRFSGAGSRSPDGQGLSYTWDLGDGARMTGAEVEHTYADPGRYTATLAVEDERGLRDQAGVEIEVFAQAPPSVTLEAPAPDTSYRAGDTITFAATATDAQGTPLGPEAFSWTVLRHHDDHTHPFLGPLEGIAEGTFTIPLEGEWEGDVWHAIYLTVTDAHGARQEVTRAILPELSTLLLETDPPGLSVTIDSVPYATPFEVEAPIDHEVRLSAPMSQTFEGAAYGFEGWEDGAPAEHRRAIQPEPTLLTARYASGLSEDERYFSETGFRIDHDQIWEYFQARGQVDSFGFPVSRLFRFLGCEVQLFQRQVAQVCEGQDVSLLNLLDPDIFPYAQVNFSAFPSPDEDLKNATPQVGEPDYAERILDFVREHTPDEFDGQRVNFQETFFGLIRGEMAGTDAPGVLAMLNFEAWGPPISHPMRDPNNPDFVYQRFQRGVMHHVAGDGVTRGLLLADYLKQLMLDGENLPPDLREQAQASRFLAQYCPDQPNWLCRPGELPGTDLSFAFEPH